MPTAEVVLSPIASAACADLQPKQAKKLAWWVERLKQDPFVGDQLPKARIPESLARRHGLPATPPNLWRLELPLAFRILYTVRGSRSQGIVVAVLEILSHRDYDRLLGYG